MATSNSPVLVLDLDGTLVDSSADLVAALNQAIATQGLSPLSTKLVAETVGKGARAMISKAFKFHNQTLDDNTLDHLMTVFVDAYQLNIANFTRPYPGARKALDDFQRLGWQLAVCTNKPERLARKLLEELELEHRFSAICGSDTFEVRKPHGGHVLKTIAAADGDVSRSLMVGDTPFDIDAAKNAGIPSVAVDFGYHDNPVTSLGADRMISHFDELLEVAQSLVLD